MEGLDMSTIRFNVWDLRPDRREAVRAWVRSLNLDPDDYSARAAIMEGEQGWELHLSRYVRNEQGSIRLDIARNDVVTEPVIVALGTTRTWPYLGHDAGGRSVTVRLKAPDEGIARAIRDALTNVNLAVRGF